MTFTRGTDVKGTQELGARAQHIGGGAGMKHGKGSGSATMGQLLTSHVSALHVQSGTVGVPISKGHGVH